MDTALESSVWVSSPEFAGWLQKRGFHWRKLWKKRWVALHGAEIVYMDKEPTLENSATMVMTKAQITSATIIEPDDIDGDPLGFKVNINNGKSPTWCLRAESDLEKKNWLTRLNHVITIVRWLEEYEKVRVLGVGGTGVVYELLHKTNGKKYAMKEMEIKNKAQMHMALQEAEMLKDIMENISHPHIIHIQKVFQVGSKFYLVFPLCTGGELYEHIIRRGNFTEYDAAILTRGLVGGINALHEEEILHLDIKPENILFDSVDIDAKIKITDFGLSRMLDSNNTDVDYKGSGSGSGPGSNPMPTIQEIEEKIVQFFDNGILNRERLRGTVGYMAPELILCGHCSKATDVFAAGVVLYILLCGRPPFQSKSNREVLEKTCRGKYTMDGPQWQDVSDDAKDLVRKMLVIDPSKRITAADVLKHSWLMNLNESSINSNGNIDSDADIVAAMESGKPSSTSTSTSTSTTATTSTATSTTTKTQPKRISSRKGSGVSLGSLRILSNHVQARRSEKLASSFTRLVSSLQAGAWTNTSQLSKQILLADGSPLPEIQCTDEDMMVLQNPDIREALTFVFEKVCADGKMPTEHFICVLRHFGMGPGAVQGPVSNLPGLFLCRFIDRDGDGFISANDLFTTQALIMQKSELFLKAVFRMYTESLWYPGRQLNLASYNRSPRKTKSPQSGNTAILDNSDENNSFNDVVEPPKFITGRHVGEVFSKIGYKAETGKRIFTILYCVLRRRRQAMTSKDAPNSSSGMLRNVRYSRDNLSDFKDDPLNSSVDSELNGLKGGLGHDDSFDGSNRDTLSLLVGGSNLIDEFSKLPTPENTSTSNGDSELSPLMPPETPEKLTKSQSETDLEIENFERMIMSNDATMHADAMKMMNSSGSAKMDVHDFIDACNLDDVLVQSVLRKPRQRFLELLTKIQVTPGTQANSSTGSDSVPKSYGSDVSDRTTEMDAAMGYGIDTSALEEQLIAALVKAEEELKGSFPLANAAKNAMLDIAAGLTGKALGVIGSLAETYAEERGGSDV
jgi:calcium/calmodulin-dependent protein kinase I